MLEHERTVGVRVHNARAARLEVRDADLLRATKERRLEVDLEVEAQVVALCRPRAPPAAARPTLAAKEGLKTSAEAGLKALTAAGECKEDVACWRGKLSDADVNVRRRATRELGWAADQESLAELLKAAEDEDV